MRKINFDNRNIGWILFFTAIPVFYGYFELSSWVNELYQIPEGVAGPLDGAAIAVVSIFLVVVIYATIKSFKKAKQTPNT